MNVVQLQQELLGELATVLGHAVGLDDELLVEAGLDSFGIMQVVTYLEERYRIRIPDEHLATSSFTSARIMSAWVLPLLSNAHGPGTVSIDAAALPRSSLQPI